MVGEPIDTKQANKVLYIAIAVILVLVVALVTNGFGLLNPSTSSDNATNSNIPLSIGESPVMGNANAPLTIYEFSDFSCPFCAAADGHNEEVIASLKSNNPNWQAPIPNAVKDYVDTGKVKLVFKYYPGHGAGEASQLVGWNLNEQGLFWNFSDLAFSNQADTGDLTKMLALAKTLGTNMTQLQQGLDSYKYDYIIQKDIDMGKANGVKGTPTFFINGQLISGAVSYPDFKKVIDQQLANS